MEGVEGCDLEGVEGWWLPRRPLRGCKLISAEMPPLNDVHVQIVTKIQWRKARSTYMRQPEGPDDMVLCDDGNDDDRDSDAAVDRGDGDDDDDDENGVRRKATSLITSPARAT